MAELLTTQEVATRLRVSVATVNKWAREGVLPSVQFVDKGQRRFRTSDVDALIGEPDKAAS